MVAGFPTHFVSQRSTSAIAICADRHPSPSSGIRHLLCTAVPHHHRCPSSSPCPSSTPFIITASEFTITVHHQRVHPSPSSSPSGFFVWSESLIDTVDRQPSKNAGYFDRQPSRTPAAILLVFSAEHHRCLEDLITGHEPRLVRS